MYSNNILNFQESDNFKCLYKKKKKITNQTKVAEYQLLWDSNTWNNLNLSKQNINVSNTQNHLSVCKQMINIKQTIHLQIIYMYVMY